MAYDRQRAADELHLRHIGTGTLVGTPLADEFVLTSFTPGVHEISGFNPFNDVVELSKAQFASLAAVDAATSYGAGGATISLDNSGSTLLLQNVTQGQLHAANFSLA